MQIILNGTAHTVDSGSTVGDLLNALNLAHRPVVTELDGRALSRSDHASTALSEGAKVEIIVLAAGG
ncbi:MAG: sulfur carrier protein ThiS [Roseibacillus sp.]|nr:sulfur carrier protein ThiS [Roseibacillus sp.]